MFVMNKSTKISLRRDPRGWQVKEIKKKETLPEIYDAIGNE